MAQNDRITIKRPDDWHVHFRDEAMMRAVVPATAAQFGRAIVMPNLVPPVTDTAAAEAYRDRILTAIPDAADFTPLMAAYLTDETDPEMLRDGAEKGVFSAVKLYPAGATTNSASGVTDIANVMPVLDVMQEIGLPLLIHGEVTDPDIDIFDREAVFIDRILQPLTDKLPALKVVFEHVTTKEAVDFVAAGDASRLGATITAHHLVINRTDIFKGGIRPHLYCLPIAKREAHRQALRKAATSGDPRYFLGTDTAPHARHLKEAACGCAGIYSAPVALEVYATVFEEEDALDKLEAFASLNGPAFYGLPVNETTVTLKRESWQVPQSIDTGSGDALIPFMAGETLGWKLEG
ncbi:MAG: dihydroorotase [Rhodospirillales bacterium]|nr:dihydroorotase [Rhodospirillales bacterium]MBO6787280.1 dihydroorotase [Rhodospirillales bacterium]